MLFDLGLSGHREERFLIKIESQDQGIEYNPEITNINGCGFFFPFPVPSDGMLCSMNVAAMLDRAKGRDFFDLMFLLGQARPDYGYLEKLCGISNRDQLKTATAEKLKTVDLKNKQRDFEHLLFDRNQSARVLRFGEFIEALK